MLRQVVDMEVSWEVMNLPQIHSNSPHSSHAEESWTACSIKAVQRLRTHTKVTETTSAGTGWPVTRVFSQIPTDWMIPISYIRVQMLEFNSNKTSSSQKYGI